jgi:hypothetical protein
MRGTGAIQPEDARKSLLVLFQKGRKNKNKFQIQDGAGGGGAVCSCCCYGSRGVNLQSLTPGRRSKIVT